jgi:hypothetical protein
MLVVAIFENQKQLTQKCEEATTKLKQFLKLLMEKKLRLNQIKHVVALGRGIHCVEAK